MKIAVDILQALLLILGAPLVRGIIARLKARLQRRQGASIWRPYADLFKLLRKEDLIPPTSSAVFRIAPILLFGSTVCAAAFVPVVHVSALLASRGDFFLLVYMLALGRFFLSLGALDGGSAFGGMGASREALVSSLAEAPFLLEPRGACHPCIPRRHSRNGRVDARAKYLQHFRRTHSGVCLSCAWCSWRRRAGCPWTIRPPILS